MATTAGEIEAIVGELRERLREARVLKIHAPRPHEVVLALRVGRETVRLLLSTHPRLARIHLLPTPRQNPPSPPPFVMILRNELEGSRLVTIENIPGERIVRLVFARGTGRPTLLGELFGGRAAVLLLGEGDVVRAGSRVELSGGRTARPGETYRAPDPRPPGPAEAPGSSDGVHDAVVRREEAEEARLELEDARRLRLRKIDRERKRLSRLASRLEQDGGNLPDPELCRRRGEALKGALHEVPRGANEVTLTAWTDAGPVEVEVPLDPRRDSLENMERWFRRARRSERGAEHLARRREEVASRLAKLDADRERLLAVTDPSELGPAPAAPRPGARTKQASGPPRFRSAEGYEILAGRSAEENETITFRIARGNDTWLHVRDRPGAHVVVRTPPGKPPPLETLLDAAVLAVHHSPARGSSGVEVSYTLRKHVRRLKGAPRGTVSVADEKSIRVDPDEERLARLYASRQTGPGE